MEEDTEVSLFDPQAPAGFSSVGLLEENNPEHLLISRRKTCQDCSNLAFVVFHHQRHLWVPCPIQLFWDLVTHGPEPRAIAVRLEQDVVADRVDERAETLGVLEPASAPERREHAKERFLVRVLNQPLGSQS